MDNLRFTAERNKIDELTNLFIEQDNLEDDWGAKYLDPITNEYWQKIQIETEFHGGGHPVMMKLPDPRGHELINIALESEDLDEISTAAALLQHNESDLKEQFRQTLIEKLESYTKMVKFQ